jgi:hypothetical protein
MVKKQHTTQQLMLLQKKPIPKKYQTYAYRRLLQRQGGTS